jgi:hypothetical protein
MKASSPYAQKLWGVQRTLLTLQSGDRERCDREVASLGPASEPAEAGWIQLSRAAPRAIGH